MGNGELLRRIEDLAERCDRSATVTYTGFLTPAEQYAVSQWAAARPELQLLLSGGGEDCERKAAFFLPYYLDSETFQPDEYIHAVKITAFFGEPSHRDYMGAALALGIRREWLGDFRLAEGGAYVFCLPSVEPLLLDELKKAGRCSLKTASCPLSQVPPAERKVKPLSFTVKSPRLDAVVGAMFGLSRTAAAELIRTGAASLNYTPCQRTDAEVSEGDVISLRGYGKGAITAIGGRSRKDRLFLEAEIFL